jgi:hypothetical protein
MRLSTRGLLQSQVHPKLLIRQQEVGAKYHEVRVDQLADPLERLRAEGRALDQIQIPFHLRDGFARNHQ